MRSEWASADSVVAFPAVIKVWTPFSLPKRLEINGGPVEKLRICPIHNLYIAPSLGLEHNAVLSSFLFEMFTRRRCSSMKSDLRFTPTEVRSCVESSSCQ
jgi:hypothetical protein